MDGHRQVYDPVAGSLDWTALPAALPRPALFVHRRPRAVPGADRRAVRAALPGRRTAGVAVTGSDTSSNAFCGVLQPTAAQHTGLSPSLLAAAHTTGGIMGKTISPQHLAITAAVVGR